MLFLVVIAVVCENRCDSNRVVGNLENISSDLFMDPLISNRGCLENMCQFYKKSQGISDNQSWILENIFWVFNFQIQKKK